MLARPVESAPSPMRWALVTGILAAVALTGVAAADRAGIAAIDWSALDYVFAATGLAVLSGLAALAARGLRGDSRRGGLAVAGLAAMLLIWVNGAVGLTDGPGDAWLAAIALDRKSVV